MDTKEPDWKNMEIAELEEHKATCIKREKEKGCLNAEGLFRHLDSIIDQERKANLLRQQLQMLWKSDNGQYVEIDYDELMKPSSEPDWESMTFDQLKVEFDKYMFVTNMKYDFYFDPSKLTDAEILKSALKHLWVVFNGKKVDATKLGL